MVDHPEEEQLEIPDELPLLPIRDVVIFPFMIMPLFVGRESSIKAVNEALNGNRLIFLATQKHVAEENPNPEDIYQVGTISMIMRMLKLPDGRVKILVQGLAKGMIKGYRQLEPMFKVEVEKIDEPLMGDLDLEMEAMMRTVKERLERVISLGKSISPEVAVVLENINDPGRLADLIVSNLGLKVEVSQEFMETIDPRERLQQINEILAKEIQVLDMQAKIQSQAKEEMTKTQREYFLKEQLKAIRTELGDMDERTQEIEELREKVKKCKMPKEANQESLKQLDRLERMHPDAAEANIIRTYLDWMIDLPWQKKTKDNLDLKQARRILDEDHYGLDKVKERIVEYLAVCKLKNKMRGPILCFVGPPGVGKTSLGKSIARALGRKFFRLSLGGMKDEAEIRGHRRTYIGALPGRIIQGIKQAGTKNPVFMMDEIDKIGSDFRGDPSSALLEVLDPEQNSEFSDHYLNVPYDLSHVMFITTANMLEPIPAALRDRMEVIHLSGYTDEEKLHIARQYLLPRQLEANGISPRYLTLSDQTLLQVASRYTRESGVRNLEREIGSLCRKVASRVAADADTGATRITPQNLHKYLGPPQYLADNGADENQVGVATGLAWTPYGGEVLQIETMVMAGKGSLVLTGHLGEVMKESAQAALSFIRTRADALGIKAAVFKESDIHIHVPAGAIPKDGPSAGVTMLTSLVSALTKVPVYRKVAMTGEVTLTGRVMPIGGLKEKVLAAVRFGATTVLYPAGNKKDLVDIPKNIQKRLELVPVSHADEVLKRTLVSQPKKGRRRKATEV
ncbi:MAG: endopeptidase La [Deltaproteobacteria bacterium]|nr:endopeptidase La [Candidatus Anaeroferrophillus wilburensis]MBN2888848.1 endopeptidase La [Deltaproteobacteria bacterium]